MKKKQKSKKQIYYMLANAVILMIFLIGGVLAFLTDIDRKINVFVIGEVDISLLEPSWVPTLDSDEDSILDANKISVGESIALNPKIQNIGDDDAYVYLKVYVPKGDYETVTTSVTDGDLFSYEIDSEHWTELPDSDSTNEDSNIYVYYYNEPLEAPNGEDSITEPLFEEITLVGKPDGERIKNVVIEAYAIQATGLPVGTTVETTLWAMQFKEYAIEHPLLLSEEPILLEIPISLGTSVNYVTSLNNVTLDNWKCFYQDTYYTYLIYGDYLTNSCIANSNIVKVGNYAIYGNSVSNLYSFISTKENWDTLLTGTLNNKNISLTRTDDIWAMGSPTKELMEQSLAENNDDWSNTLYLPYGINQVESSTHGFWLSTLHGSSLYNAYYKAQFSYATGTGGTNYSIRPIIRIPSVLLVQE